MKHLALSLLVAALSAACTGKYVRPTTQDKVDATPERIARGNYLVNSVTMCGVCHTPRVGGGWLGGERSDAFLSGGTLFDDREADFKVVAPNISQDVETGIGGWTDDEILRAVRDGVRKDGELLWPPMPFPEFGKMSDEDARSIVAYLRTTPPVKNRIDRDKVNDFPFLFKMLHGMGVMHHKPARDVKGPPAGDRKAQGEYLVRIGLCFDCHSLTSTGPDEDNFLGGSKAPLNEPDYGKVWARNLTSDMETGLGKYSAEQIKQALKTGKRLDGKPMAPPMSLIIPHVSTWTEADLDALVAYIKTVPAIKNKVPDPELTPAARKMLGQ